MKNQKGFIQIPLLIALIAGVLALGGVSYFGIKQYQSYRVENSKNEKNPKTSAPELSEVEKLRQEIEELKKQTLQNQQKITSTSIPQDSLPVKKRVVLSNAQIIKKLKPAVVYIETNKGSGTGMIIETNGLVLTNAHVVKGATLISIKLSDGKVFSAEVVGRDEIKDIALLKANSSSLPIVDLGNSDLVAQGDEVFALGYPFGLEGDVSFKEGTISRRLSGDDVEYFESSTEIHPGNSGGPLVNKYGEVIGINTAKLGQKVGSIAVGETIKLAIPINVAKGLIGDLKLGKNILPPKPPAFDEFEKFAKDLKSSSDLHGEALKLSGDAASLAVEERYSIAFSKTNQAISVLSSAISKLKSIAIPPVSFSQTISELITLEIALYEKHDLEIMKLERYRYEVMSKPYTDIDSEIAKLTLANKIGATISDRYDTRTEFNRSQFFPKLGEYVGYAKPYLDIIYPKE